MSRRADLPAQDDHAAPTVVAAKIDSRDTAWILISTALVMLMTPGLALFYGGMARGKNVLVTLMQSFVAIAVISVQWILIGYTLSFGPDINGIIGSLDWIGLRGVGAAPNPDYAATVPHLAFMIYQAMFAVITPALITGAFAERMKFSAPASLPSLQRWLSGKEKGISRKQCIPIIFQ
jgi:Amt family ammonium transporter